MSELTDLEKRHYIRIISENKNIDRLSELKSKIPQKFYRYRSLLNEYEIENMMHKQIWLSRPTEFNDPYDSMINIDTEELLKECLEMDKEIISVYEKLDRKSKRKTQRFVEKEKKELQKKINIEWEKQRKLFGIACFSEIYDSLLMWSHYADYHKGICLEYDFKELLNKAMFCPVIYTGRFENISKCIDLKNDMVSNRVIELILSKAKDWSYENEWRMLDTLSESGKENGKLLKGLKPLKILLGCRIEDNNERKIIKVANKLHIPVKKMRMDTKKFRVYVEE